jgi:putative membrane protein
VTYLSPLAGEENPALFTTEAAFSKTDMGRPHGDPDVPRVRAAQRVASPLSQAEMQAEVLTHVPAAPRALRFDVAVYASLIAATVLLWWLCRRHAAILLFWAPWDFSVVEFLCCWLAVYWYIRGLALTEPAERSSLIHHLAFFAGVLSIYAVLETRFEYFAEHQFFFNRIQHVVMHHFAPLLLALAWPGATLMRGMPAWMRRIALHPALIRTVHALQQPVLAAVLFVGTFFFWLIPTIHFRAMIDARLFTIMNWTMVVEGILFWCLVLDPRPSPPARASFGARAALSMVVMFPQIIGGAMIAFNPHDLYSFYDLCGRIYPDLGAHYDQTVGGLIIWIPPAMMSVLGLLLVLNALRRAEERKWQNDVAEFDSSQPGLDSSRWTGG